jgi:hypothetical protein
LIVKIFSKILSKIIKKPGENRYAYVSVEYGVLGRENFPWRIEKRIGPKGDAVFTILGKFENSSEVSIIPDKSVQFSSDLFDEGISIRFYCLAKEVPNFRIEAK